MKLIDKAESTPTPAIKKPTNKVDEAPEPTSNEATSKDITVVIVQK